MSEANGVHDLAGRLQDAEARLEAAEARFRNIIERTVDGIVVVDEDGRVRFANAAAELLFGRSSRELVGHHFGYPLAAAASAEVDVHAPGRPPRVVEMRVARSRWEDQPVFLASLRDVTDRKRLEEERAAHQRERAGRAEAEASARRLRFLAEAGTLLASSLDPAGPLEELVSRLVPAVADWCLLLVAERDGDQVYSAHGDPDRAPRLDELVPLFGSGDGFSGAQALVTRRAQIVGPERAEELDPRSRHLLQELGYASAAHLPLVVGDRTLGVLSLARSGGKPPRDALTGERYTEADRDFLADLARRTALALDNARLYRQAEEASRTRDEFMAKVSHELRTPLQAILGWTAMLREADGDGSQVARALEVIERNARAQVHLIDDILDVSRILAGKLALDAEAIDLGEVVRGAVETLEPQARDEGIELAYRPPGEPLALEGDPLRLQQVVINLINNALKYTPRGGKVDVELRRDGAVAEIEVCDDGVGMDGDLLTEAFQPFRRGPGRGDRAGTQGLGLGLSIVQHLVEMHGGRVSAESDGEGCGSTLTVRLPLPEHTLGDVAGADAPHGDGNGAVDLAGLEVLLVDDQPDARELLALVLERAGAAVATAGSADEVLALLDDGARPDVLVSDIGMPKIDGYELIRRVRGRRDPHASVPAVAVTGFAAADDRVRALEAGFQEHMAKPVDVAGLTAVVARLAAQREAGEREAADQEPS